MRRRLDDLDAAELRGAVLGHAADLTASRARLARGVDGGR